MYATYTSHGATIGIDVYRPAAVGRYPALLVLHGSGGVHDFSSYAHSLANEGYAIFVPHYFDATGTKWASEGEIATHALTWATTIIDAISYAVAEPFVISDSIALIGFSLGGYLAIGVASQDERVRAVVDFFGGLPAAIAPMIRRLPPVLILHGEADRVVPISEAHRLKRFCEES